MEYDLSYDDSPSLKQTLADLLRGMSKKQAYQELGQGIQNTAKVIPSVVESLGRGAIAQVPGTFGDISELARQFAPETMQNVMGNRVAPTTEEILAKVPRLNPNYEGSQSHEMIGGLVSPAMPSLLRAGAKSMQNMPIGNMIAYHGTPHEIQGGFDISKVGTGEGAQAYGHGMYFAENPKVAEEYQKRLSGKTTFGERPSDSAYVHAVESFRDANYPLEQIPAEMKKAYKSITDKDIQLAIQASEKGNLYKVDIPDEYVPKMLDWDKPLLKQSKEVQEALAKLGIKTDKDKLKQFDDSLLNALLNDGNKPLPKQPINPSGEDIYKTFVQGNPQLTSQKLNEVGIKGIRYTDEGSRNWRILPPDESVSGKWTVGKWPGGGKETKYFDNEKDAKEYLKQNYTSNFVVFDPKEVKILEKNNKPTRKEVIEQELKKIE